MNLDTAHQYKIRVAKSKEKTTTLKGKYWEKLDLNLKSATVKRVDKEIAKEIILKYEWLGTMSNTSKHYGIYFDGVCGGVICLGKNCTANHNVPMEFGLKRNEVWTLARGACVHWSPKGSASKLIAKGLKLFKDDVPNCKVVIAYSDTNAGEIGTVYQATNWYYIGRGNHSTVNYFHPKLKRKFDERMIHTLKKKWKCSRREAINKLLSHGWEIEKKAIKHKYIYILGNRNEKSQILSRTPKLPYPKRGEENE